MILPEIVKRIPGYTDKMMTEYIELLLKSLNTGNWVIKRKGRGKDKQSYKVYEKRFEVEEKTIKRLEESLKHYNGTKTLSETNSQ